MAGNPQRRIELADAGIRVLAREGTRGLTHRAVDDAAGAPRGTSANYWRSRDALIAGLFERIADRVSIFDAADAIGAASTPRDALRLEYRAYIENLTRDPDLGRAYLALRLEAGRDGALGATVPGLLRRRFGEAVDEFTEVGGPGNERLEILLTHCLLIGTAFDRLSVSVDPETPVGEITDLFADAMLLLYEARTREDPVAPG